MYIWGIVYQLGTTPALKFISPWSLNPKSLLQLQVSYSLCRVNNSKWICLYSHLSFSALFGNEDDITNFHRLAVDCHVGSDWRFLGLELAGFSNGQMDQLEEPFKANQYPFREVIYQLLLMWEAQCDIRPTVGMLAKALWKCKMYPAFMSLLKAVSDSKKQF